MIGKKINQLATELAPVSTDLTIIGDPTTGVSKKITLAQLGAIFSGAVSFYTDLASFPVTGDINVIYCAKDTQKLYLWSGSAYVEVFPSQALLNTYQLRSEKGVSNGYASLDSGGKVPISQLPSSIMEYKGTWNAATNTPTLANGTGDTGDVYICNVAGTVNFGAGPLTFAVGDYVIYSGSIWQRSSGAVGTVTSVALTVGGDAISVSGSPLTTSGTLALAFSGTTSQYIRGNGTLANFPTSLVSGTGTQNRITKWSSTSGEIVNSNIFDTGTTITNLNATADFFSCQFNGNATTGRSYGALIVAGTNASDIALRIENVSSTSVYFYVWGDGRVQINNIPNATTDTDKFLVSDSGVIKYRTGAELLSDIGGASASGYVPYTGATANLDLGTFDLTTDIINLNQLKAFGSGGLNIYSNSGTHIALMGGGGGAGTTFYGGIIGVSASFTSSGSSDTFGITHSSGSGIALNITKGGNGEGLYINKTSGSGNAATIIGTLNATTLVKSGGTSSQFLKADGSVDSTSYGTGSVTSVGLSSATSGVTIGSTPITTSGTITLAIATASGSAQGLLSSTDWTTFNNKQNALTNPVTGTGTTNYLPKFTGASTIGDSVIQEASSNIGIGGSPSTKLHSFGTIRSSNAGNTINTELQSDGVYSTATDLYLLAPSTKSIYFYTNNAQKMLLDASGNLGLGVTPSAWRSTDKVLQINNGSLYDESGTNLWLGQNFYENTSGSYIYSTSAAASAYRQFSGQHNWFIAASGTAGNAISFTQAMTLNASGNLSIGNTNDTYKLDVTGTGRFTSSLSAVFNSTTNNPYIRFDQSGSAKFFIGERSAVSGDGGTGYDLYTVAGNDLRFFAGATKALTLASTGAATFSSSVTAGGELSTTSGLISISGGGGAPPTGGVGLRYVSNRLIVYGGSTDFTVQKNSNAGPNLTILESGAATFSSSVTATSGTFSQSSGITTIIQSDWDRSATNNTQLYIRGNTNTNKQLRIGYDTAGNVGYIQALTSGTGVDNLLINPSGGSVGIGTTSPSGKLNVFGAKPSITSVEVGVVTIDDSTSYAAGVGGSLLLRGNYRGLGDQVGAAGIEASKVNSTDGDYGFNMLFYTRQNGSSLAEKMRITSGGEVVIGGTNTTGSGLTVYSSGVGNTGIEIRTTATSGNNVVQYNRMAVAGTTSNYLFAGQDSTQDKIYIYGNGNVVNRNNSYGAISDIKLKENISDTTSKLADLLKVKVRNYNLIGDDKKQIGVIAQELETIFPSMVEVDGKTGMKQVKYSVFVPMLIKAIQELNDKIK